MNDMNEQSYQDLRHDLARVQTWVQAVMARIGADQLGAPTPCPDFDVKTLIGHLNTGAERIAVMAEGHDARSVPPVLDVGRDPAAEYGRRAARGQQAWAQWDDLSKTVVAPFGELPAAAALGNYLCESLAHGWDLAVATGQPAEVDDDLATTALGVSQRRIPAERRGGPIPFGPVVESAADATPIERFVNWTGRDSAAWPKR